MYENHIHASFNSGGHPLEWTIHFPGYSLDRYIPFWIENELAHVLGEQFHVDNRGSRLEVTSPLIRETHDPHTEVIVKALTGIIESAPVTTDVTPYTPPVPKLRDCLGCGQGFGFRELFEHRKSGCGV